MTQTQNREDYRIKVITPQNYSEISVKMTETLAAGPKMHSNVIYPLYREHQEVEYIIDSCQELQDSKIITKSGQILDYDVCVVATGLSFPIFQPSIDQPTTDSRKYFISHLCEKIRRAKTVVIAGGGPVGCEVAADLKLRHKNKR